MSSWSTFVAMSGFHYDGPSASVVALPKIQSDRFQCFWATGTGWGTYSLHRQNGSTRFAMKVLMGILPCRSCEFAAVGNMASIEFGNQTIRAKVDRKDGRVVVTLDPTLRLVANDEISITVSR